MYRFIPTIFNQLSAGAVFTFGTSAESPIYQLADAATPVAHNPDLLNAEVACLNSDSNMWGKVMRLQYASQRTIWVMCYVEPAPKPTDPEKDLYTGYYLVPLDPAPSVDDYCVVLHTPEYLINVNINADFPEATRPYSHVPRRWDVIKIYDTLLEETQRWVVTKLYRKENRVYCFEVDNDAGEKRSYPLYALHLRPSEDYPLSDVVKSVTYNHNPQPSIAVQYYAHPRIDVYFAGHRYFESIHTQAINGAGGLKVVEVSDRFTVYRTP